MFFYAMFAEFSRRGVDGGAAALDDLTLEHFAESFAMIAHARCEQLGVGEASSYPGFDFLPEMLAQLGSQSADDWLEFKDKFLVIAARIKGKFSRKGLDERGTSRYGLCVAPGRLKFL